jgi:DnaJ-class molecular chaperone
MATEKHNPESQKYPEDKKKFDENWIRIFGKVCPKCKGKTIVSRPATCEIYIKKYNDICPKCKGLGKVEK